MPNIGSVTLLFISTLLLYPATNRSFHGSGSLYVSISIVSLAVSAICMWMYSDQNRMNETRVRFVLSYRILQTLDLLLLYKADQSPEILPRSVRSKHYQGWKKYYDLFGTWRTPEWLEFSLLFFREPRHDSYSRSYASPNLANRTSDLSAAWHREAVYIVRWCSSLMLLALFWRGVLVRTLMFTTGIYIYFTCTIYIMSPYSSPPFSRPFSASSISDFWSNRWHAMLHSPLHTAFYKPIRRLTNSRVAAVLATFTASGLWHAYGFAPVLGIKCAVTIVGFFIFMALGVILDNAIFARSRNQSERCFMAHLRRVLAWLWVLGLAILTFVPIERRLEEMWMQSIQK